jgi:hypothetical protein
LFSHLTGYYFANKKFMQKGGQVREQMFAMITHWQSSGLSQKAYCEEHGIGYHVFHYWYKCFRDWQFPAKEKGFIPLKIGPSNAANSTSAHAELLLADGRRLIFHQAVSSDYLKRIIS